MKITQLTQKVLFLCCAMLLFTGFEIQAQDIQGGGKPLSFGIRAGYSAPVLTVDNQPVFVSRLAPVIGGFAQYRVLPWVAASLEVVYTQYGGNSISPTLIYSPDSPILDNLGKTDLSIHSIEVPISAKIGLPGMTGAVKPFISIGASAAFFLQANVMNYYIEDNASGFPYLYNANNIVSSRLKKYDYSCISGAGMEFQGDKLNFSIEIFYRIGFSNLNASHKTYAPDYRANAFGVKIGIGL